MKVSSILILCLFSFALSAQNSALVQADSLIALKKYNSAFSLLNKVDPDNSISDLAIKKTEIVLDYFATSINHRMFALTDLEPNQDILDIRGSEGSFEMYPFDPSEVLPALIEEHPNDYNLHAALGKYYHEVHTKYGTNSTMPEAQITDLMHEYCLKAANNDIKDAKVYYIIGYYETLSENYGPSINWFEKSLEVDSTFATCTYNLAVAYYFEKQADKALPYAKKATVLYEEPNLKSDAARLTAVIYKSLDKQEKALEYFIKANSILPNNYYNLNQLLEQQLVLKKFESAEVSTQEFYALDPTNPRICSDLLEIYRLTNQVELLEKFFIAKTEEMAGDEELGNLYFHLGQIKLMQDDTKAAKKYLKTAKKHFLKVFDKDHYVFKVIDDELKK